MGYFRHAKEAKTAKGFLPLLLASQQEHIDKDFVKGLIKRLVKDGAYKEVLKVEYVTINTDQLEMHGK